MKASFDDFYRSQYGTRWECLREALLSPEEDKASPEGLIRPYFMDRTSIETAMALGATPGESILDMCAAPGGKSIVIALSLKGSGELVSNDRSPERRLRMRRAFEDSLPEDHRTIITITGHDASRWGLYEQERYDRILLDAPCSSERHVLQSPEHLAIWSPSRPKRLAAMQYSMLASALLALKPGGRLLYSTCSINRAEDEGIIERLMERKPGIARHVDIDLAYGEKRSYGTIVLPDRAGGRGPMYAAMLEKI